MGVSDKDGLAADQLTDILALGTAFYHITQGHELFPELDAFYDEEQPDHKSRISQVLGRGI